MSSEEKKQTLKDFKWVLIGILVGFPIAMYKNQLVEWVVRWWLKK